MSLPLPETLNRLVATSASLSLRFERGYDGYGERWLHRHAQAGQKDGKTAFLEAFVGRFNGDTGEKALHGEMIARRTKALEPLPAERRTNTSPIVAGIGRWNPVEVGFTFDRFCGVPFLPGSTVKGLLHAAADLVAAGELDGDRSFWTSQTVSRIFGEQEQSGAFAFYDAYPERWPRLEIDVMTPHHSHYYDHSQDVAADWDEPIPVHFLRVEAGTPFLFWFGERTRGTGKEGDRETIAALLTTALDWLGVGAKTSSGYGWFEARQEREAHEARTESILWEDAVLEWLPQTGVLKVSAGNQRAETKDSQILKAVPDGVWKRLKRHALVRAAVRVRRDHNLFVITGIDFSERPR
jgi:CRISPR type III-B/RAMP module RAMP protein Cmr6